MTQRIHPSADRFDTNSGTFPSGWYLGTSGLGTNLFSGIDDDPYDSTSGDYVACRTQAPHGVPQVFVVDLEDAEVPTSPFGWQIWFIGSYLTDANPGGNGTLDVQLIKKDDNEGNLNPRVVFSGRFSDSGTTRPFSATQATYRMDIDPDANVDPHSGISYNGAKSVTDFKDLQLRFSFSQPVDAGCVIYNALVILPRKVSHEAIIPGRRPVSPIYGEVFTAGSVNQGPMCQLLNPTTSPFKLIVWELWLWGGGDNAGIGSEGRQAINAIRRTDNPLGLGLGGHNTLGKLTKLDPDNTQTIWGILQGMDFTNAQFHGPDAPFGNIWKEFEDPARWGIDNFYSMRPAGVAPVPDAFIRRAGSFPLTIMPGSALEAVWMSTANQLRMGVLFDQVPIFG